VRALALVTGASGGIGAEIARALAARGIDLALTARSRPQLDALADEIAAKGRPRPLVRPLDLGAPGAPQQLQEWLKASDARATILVNNAGYGLMGEVSTLDRAEQLGIVDLNIHALVDLTLLLLPDIRAARGRILNVASVAAFFPGPGMAVYYASKAFVLSFSEALTQELRAAGVSVTVLCPGLTSTGFQARAGMGAGLAKMMPTMDAATVAEAGVAAMMAGRRRVVPGFMNQMSTMLTAFVPRSLFLPVIGRIQGARRHK
jgi:short-subunit dehydrogenase